MPSTRGASAGRHPASERGASTGRARRVVTDGGRPVEAAGATPDSTTFVGSVTSGEGLGGEFVSLPDYREQFVERLDYEPFPGTLNVAVDDVDARERLRDRAGTIVDGWEDCERSFGAVRCFPVVVTARDTPTRGPAHVVVPVRTEHDPYTLELVAPVELRDALGVADGDGVTVRLGDREGPT